MMKLSGSMTALATPFKNGALDEAAYEWLVNDQIANGTSVLIPMGTTGESVTMSATERRRAIEVCIAVNKGRVKVFAHGQSEPVESNASAGGRAKNRRVEIVAM